MCVCVSALVIAVTQNVCNSILFRSNDDMILCENLKSEAHKGAHSLTHKHIVEVHFIFSRLVRFSISFVWMLFVGKVFRTENRRWYYSFTRIDMYTFCVSCFPFGARWFDENAKKFVVVIWLCFASYTRCGNNHFIFTLSSVKFAHTMSSTHISIYVHIGIVVTHDTCYNKSRNICFLGFEQKKREIFDWNVLHKT